MLRRVPRMDEKLGRLLGSCDQQDCSSHSNIDEYAVSGCTSVCECTTYRHELLKVVRTMVWDVRPLFLSGHSHADLDGVEPVVWHLACNELPPVCHNPEHGEGDVQPCPPMPLHYYGEAEHVSLLGVLVAGNDFRRHPLERPDYKTRAFTCCTVTQAARSLTLPGHCVVRCLSSKTWGADDCKTYCFVGTAYSYRNRTL